MLEHLGNAELPVLGVAELVPQCPAAIPQPRVELSETAPAPVGRINPDAPATVLNILCCRQPKTDHSRGCLVNFELTKTQRAIILGGGNQRPIQLYEQGVCLEITSTKVHIILVATVSLIENTSTSRKLPRWPSRIVQY